jgi:hypothetical protein
MKRACICFLTISAIRLSGQTPADQAREQERAAALVERAEIQLQLLLNGVATRVTVGGAVVKGHPFSATEENRSSQVLGNGARIENNTSGKQYRDTEGRTRTEAPDGTITITDPVAGFRATLNPKTKVASKTNVPVGGGGRGFVIGGGLVTVNRTATSVAGGEAKEDLGSQGMNGVLAHGERVTVTIPRGEIGNDRELKVVTERWTSQDLQMLIKSVNSDPRYGDTVYELTGISLAAPNPALFQIPADYTVTEGGGRGGAPAVTVAPGARR